MNIIFTSIRRFANRSLPIAVKLF